MNNLDILEFKYQSMVIPVNCVGIMGAGLALSFKNKFPHIYEEYRKLCSRGGVVLGRVNVYTLEDQAIIFFPTKDHWKDDSQVIHIEKGLIHLNSKLEELGIKEVAMPKIGCGLGKLDWKTQVLPLIHKHLTGEYEVYLY